MDSKDYFIARKLKEKLSKLVSVVALIVFGLRVIGDQENEIVWKRHQTS